MQTKPEQEELSPAMQVAVEALNRNAGSSGPAHDFEEYRLPRSREGEAVARHQQTMAALNSLDSMKWSVQ